MSESMVKIIVAAETVGVSYKTLYNWIEDGTLRLAHPGYVYLSEVRQALLIKRNTISEWGKTNSGRFFRENGKFKLLTGEHNNKIQKSLTD